MVLGLELGGSLAVELLDEVCVCSAAKILFLIHGHSRNRAGKSFLLQFPTLVMGCSFNVHSLEEHLDVNY